VVEFALSAPDLQTWAPVASAVFAFLAATASWVSIRLTRRQWLASQRPYLVPQLVRAADGTIRLEVRNTGAGGAYGVRFCIAVGTEFLTGYAGPQFGGYLATDETAVVQTGLTAQDGEIDGVVTYWDTIDRIFVSTLDAPQAREVRGRRRRATDPTDPEDAFRKSYRRPADVGRTRVSGLGKPKIPAGAAARSTN
jgi:hypothetical protein